MPFLFFPPDNFTPNAFIFMDTDRIDDFIISLNNFNFIWKRNRFEEGAS